jgi:hypothetical protein
LLRFWVAGYFPSEWLTGCTRHVASRTNIFATMLRPGGKRADSTGVQTLPAGPDLVFTVAGADLVLIGCSIRTNSQPRASDTWPRARHTILVAIFPALLTSAAVVRGILAVLERAYEPFLSLANTLAVRARELEFWFLEILSVDTICLEMKEHLPGSIDSHLRSPRSHRMARSVRCPTDYTSAPRQGKSNTLGLRAGS